MLFDALSNLGSETTTGATSRVTSTASSRAGGGEGDVPNPATNPLPAGLDHTTANDTVQTQQAWISPVETQESIVRAPTMEGNIPQGPTYGTMFKEINFPFTGEKTYPTDDQDLIAATKQSLVGRKQHAKVEILNNDHVADFVNEHTVSSDGLPPKTFHDKSVPYGGVDRYYDGYEWDLRKKDLHEVLNKGKEESVFGYLRQSEG